MNEISKSVSVIIPTLSKNPLTLQSIPKNIEIILSDWKTDNKKIFATSVARNIGAMKAKNEILVFMDDDIQFSESFFYDLTSSVGSKQVAGLKNPWHDYLITRSLAIRRDDFFQAGGFDPMMIFCEDVEFSYRLKYMNFEFVRFPIDSVEHKPHAWRDPRNFIQYMMLNSIISLKYPLYFKRLPRKIVDYYYHKLIGLGKDHF